MDPDMPGLTLIYFDGSGKSLNPLDSGHTLLLLLFFEHVVAVAVTVGHPCLPEVNRK